MKSPSNPYKSQWNTTAIAEIQALTLYNKYYLRVFLHDAIYHFWTTYYNSLEWPDPIPCRALSLAV